MKLLIISLAIVGLILYGLYQLLIFLLTKNEQNYQKHAHRVTWTHEDMVAMAKKLSDFPSHTVVLHPIHNTQHTHTHRKRDHKMSDEEFHIKYGIFRHETYRALSIPRRVYTGMNDYLYWIELYLIHWGPSFLQRKVAIDRPIFIIGDFRSGTSNLERLIAHHPDVGYFNMAHTFVWKCPFVWDLILRFLAHLRLKLTGAYGAGNPRAKGLFFPHSSNVLLTRGRPFECENIWEWCKSNLPKNRFYDWETLDSKNNPDNNTNCDVLDKRFDDPSFETVVFCFLCLCVCYISNMFEYILQSDETV